MRLSEFLLARIADDEAQAKHVGVGESTTRADELTVCFDRGYSEPTGWLDIDPARVLAQCKAHRQIVEYHNDAMADPCSGAEHMGVSFEVDECPHLRALASIYADHLDYDEAWRS